MDTVNDLVLNMVSNMYWKRFDGYTFNVCDSECAALLYLYGEFEDKQGMAECAWKGIAFSSAWASSPSVLRRF